MKALFMLNDTPYGSERTYSALRLATALRAQDPPATVRIFLRTDAVYCARPGHNPSQGHSIEKMLRQLADGGAEVEACVTCIESRGLKSLELIPGVRIGTMTHLAEWVSDSERVLTF